tara:strand:+ start:2751 stop:3374 length:624 start_codon:yes stop_codon:yes gene_type:complete
MDREIHLADLSVRICFDALPPTDQLYSQNFSVYSFAHNEINIPHIADKIRKSGLNMGTFILDNKVAMSGVSKSSTVEDIYKQYGVLAQKIPYNNTWINTKIEADRIADWAHENKLKYLIVCSPVFHTVRSYMTLVSSLIDKNYDKDIKVYALGAEVVNWKSMTISHQGKKVTSFNEFIKLENDRIKVYQEKGDIKSNDEIWNYIINR